jgi:sulfite reductase (ferredoxin)
MFDMIDFDRDAILSSKKRSKKRQTKNWSINCFTGSSPCFRMLLVTRGIEPENRDRCIHLLYRILHPGRLCAAEIRTAWSNWRSKIQRRPFLDSRPLIEELADTVITPVQQYGRFTQFKNDTATPKGDRNNRGRLVTQKGSGIFGSGMPDELCKDHDRTFRHESGELLEILLDDGAPIRNVPGSVRSEGHAVLKENKEGNFWSVLIQKQ